MSDRRQPETFGCEPTALGGGSLHRLDMLRGRLAAVEGALTNLAGCAGLDEPLQREALMLRDAFQNRRRALDALRKQHIHKINHNK